MKPKDGCLDLLLTPISPTGPLAAFLVGHYGVFRIYFSVVGGKNWPHTIPSRVALVISGLLFASFASMTLWRLTSKLLSEGFGELDESALGKRATRITWILGLLGLSVLGIAALLISMEPERESPATTIGILFPFQTKAVSCLVHGTR